MAIEKVALSLAFLCAASFLLAESTVTTTTKFDSYIGIADKLQVPGDRLRVYQAVWGEICADGAHNLTQMKVFYDALLKGVNSPKPDEQQQTKELGAAVRDVLIADNGRLLAETLNNNKSEDVNQVSQFRQALFNEYDVELLSAIFERAIDLAYPFHSADNLYNMLDAIDSKLSVYRNEQLFYRVRVNWTLYLYWKFLALNEVNDNYVYNAAKSIHNLERNANMYKTLDSATVRRINKSFNTFTSSLRHLFNTTNICLENKNFEYSYLFFPRSSVGSSGSVQAIVKYALLEHTAWANSFAISRQAVIPNQFSLSYAPNGWMLYRRSDRFIVVQNDGSNPGNRYWTPLLRRDKIMFENNGYYMCVTADYNGALQGFNVKAVVPSNLDDPMCQWIVTNCSELL